MQLTEFQTYLDSYPVIASVKDENGLNACLPSNCRIVFVLYGSLLDIPMIVNRITEADKIAIVHLDLIDGLAARESAVDYIAAQTRAAGIISTKSILIKRAKQLGLLAIQRFFLLDSLALSNIARQTAANNPDVIEVIPGAMPKIIKIISENASVPVIAGGLLRDSTDVINALQAGARAISSTDPQIWAKI